MFGNMKQLYEMQKQAREIQKHLESMHAEKTSKDGLLNTTVNGLQRIETLSIDPSYLTPEKKAALEKALIQLINESMEHVQKQATAQAAQMMKGFPGA